MVRLEFPNTTVSAVYILADFNRDIRLFRISFVHMRDLTFRDSRSVLCGGLLSGKYVTPEELVDREGVIPSSPGSRLRRFGDKWPRWGNAATPQVCHHPNANVRIVASSESRMESEDRPFVLSVTLKVSMSNYLVPSNVPMATAYPPTCRLCPDLYTRPLPRQKPPSPRMRGLHKRQA